MMLKIFSSETFLIVPLYVMGAAASLLDSLSQLCSHAVITYGAVFVWIRCKENICKYGVKFPGLFNCTPKLYCQMFRRNMTMRWKMQLIIAFQSEKLVVSIEYHIWRTVALWFLTKYYLGDQIEKNEMGTACNTKDFDGETWGKETTWKTQAYMGG
jgi:hypothetical protein